jgi:hypothetical protein
MTGDRKRMDRRTALALIAAGVVPSRVAIAQHQIHAAKAHPGSYTLQFFTPGEHRVLDRVSEMIIPSDEHSPGAAGARVADFIDLVMANSTAQVQLRWRAGIESFGGSASATMLDKAAAEERAPTSDAGRFFVELKRMTLHAYYTSEIGLRKELGYLGPEVLASFPGCKA